MPAFADILVQIDAPGLEQPFTYRIPDGVSLEIGDPVLIPFGPQQAVGYVIGFKDDAPPEMAGKIKPLTGRIENGIGFSAEQYALAQWVADQTLCDLRDAIRLIAPDVLTSQIKTIVHLTDDWEANLSGTRSESQKSVAMALASLGGVAETSKLVRTGGGEQVGAALTALRRKNVVWEERSVSLPPAKQKKVRVLRLAVTPEVGSEEATRLERSGAAVQARLLRALLEEASASSLPVSGLSIAASAGAAARALAEKRLATYDEVIVQRDPFRSFGFGQTDAPPLTDAQAKAAQTIGTHVAAQDGRTILLHGVTGSGKTEVYLDAVAQTLRSGKNALILLPEIGLTAQVLDLFKTRFGADDVAVLHSALSLGERHDEWRRILTGAARVVVGARSAVFAPVSNLGLMILDEEHDGSYKQDTTPRYHARDVAQQRAALTGAIVVLGSATPSVESYHKAQRGQYILASLIERIDSRPLPPVEIVDLRAEFGKPKTRRPKKTAAELEAEEKAKTTDDSDPPPTLSLFSKSLTEAITARLAKREQTILFLNRRGFASFLLCRDCGFTFRCPNCDVSLTYHHHARLLQCHHCDYRRRPPEVCPKCAGLRLRPFGLGTEKVETGVAQEFPKARVLRMDRDTTARKGAHAEILRAFRRGEADILIGTQMVTKGLDFPNVTLVGVISADTALNIPDFRSAERAFQLLTQVAGRAGRGQTPGEVIVQTFTPEHESVCRAAEHDYLGFYAGEIVTREEVGYPPFAHLANLVFADEDEALAQKRSRYLSDIIAEVREKMGMTAQILGPVACPLSRLRGRYRWHLVIRCSEKPALLSLLRQTLTRLTAAERTGLTIDIDPLTML